MDYLAKINEVVKKLEDNEEEKFAERINSLKENAFTSTELLMSVTHELLIICKEKKIKTLIGDDAIDLQNYCRSIGLHVK
ncbi:hypothetical protein QQ008_00955 [Fulvivirgaceae bacterium BMA10]|uniref:Uncharacterized protein n=1 Tax=Splendidivirga corallicola TaxID=3051826 RepID=A0ABT8KI18_9BACT|nr:hypothetical protein [Fulvivirgaceae bacterium BMA10]